MSLVLIYGEAFCGQREVARSVGEQLGYRVVTPDVVMERAAAWGEHQDGLTELLQAPPRFFGRLLRRVQRQLAFLRAAALEEIRSGDGVCYGQLAELLLESRLPAIRVRLKASTASRARAAGGILNVRGREASEYLRRADRARKAWLSLLRGGTHGKPVPHLVINLDVIELSEAARMIVALVHRAQEIACGSDAALLENEALAARIGAVLCADPATAHLELAIESRGGSASIQGPVRAPRDWAEIGRVVWRVPGVSEINLNGERLRPGEAIAAGRTVQRGLPSAAPVLGLTLAAVLIFSGLITRFGTLGGGSAFSRRGSRVEAISGVVTDIRCGTRHSQAQSEQCVRACVARGDRYVLDDGRQLYELSDQQKADRFAARKVRVIGEREKDAKYIQVQNIELF